MLDVTIVGAGPAGLSAALILGRCLRDVAVCDNASPRNAYSNSLHGFISRDGIPPSDFLKISKDDLKKYDSIQFFNDEVIEAKKTELGFELKLKNGDVLRSKKLLLATGVLDVVPKIEGIMDFYGKSVFTCPYCDAWEMRGKPIAVYGKAERGFKLASNMLTWSKDIVLCTDGSQDLDPEKAAHLKGQGIQIREEKIKSFHGEKGQLEVIEFEEGLPLSRQAVFFNTQSFIRSKLLEQLNCHYTHEEGAPTGKYARTEVPGLFIAGNICRNVQLVIVAAAEGAEAAFGINVELTAESLPYSLN